MDVADFIIPDISWEVFPIYIQKTSSIFIGLTISNQLKTQNQ